MRICALLALAAVAAIVCVGCGGSSSSGTGQLQVSLVDAPLNADEINVTITSVDVHSSGGGWKTIKTYNPGLEVNLLDYSTSGSSLMLADVPLEAGHYTQVRLMLSDAEVVIGGTPHDVDLANVAQTGVKCVREFTVQSGQLVALILDFNAAKSFVNNPPGSENFKLHPVMTMSPVNIASEVTGTVKLEDSAHVQQPIPEGTTVDVYPQGSIGVADALITGAVVESDGTFRISVLAAGTYDIRVTAGTVTKDLTGVVIRAPATDLGTIIVVTGT